MTVNDDGFRSFFDLSLDLFLIVDFAGNIVASNDTWKNALGYERNELLNRPLFDFVYSEDLPQTGTQMNRSAQGLDVTNFENRWVARDGSLRWLRWRSRVDNQKGLVFGVAVDITTEKAHLKLLKSTQEKLESSLKKEIEAKEEFKFHRERIESLFMQVPGLASILRGPEHVVEFANESFRKLFGSRDIIGRPTKDIVPGLNPEISSILDNVFQRGERFIGKNISIDADWLGDGMNFARVFDFIYEPIFAHDRKPEGIWVLAFDVTEHSKLDRERRISDRMASLGRLAAGVAHEINNPLAYSLGNLEVCLSSRTLDPNLKPMIEKTIDGIERVATIVKGLKAFSRIDDSKFVSSNLKDEITAALSIANHEVKLSQAAVTLDLNHELSLWAPRGSICQIVMNLVVNSAHAVSYTSKKEIRIQAEMISHDYIQLVVEDTGSGIDRSILDSIFEPFVTTQEVGQGTGLGLSIVHGLVQNLNGTIAVHTEIGKGTSIKVTLPRKAPDVVSDASKGITPSHKSKRILVIDDEPELRNVISFSLSEHEVETFERISDALASYEDNREFIDVILCDLSLRGETGRDLYNLVRAKWPGDESKIVFMTGGATQEMIADWVEAVPNKVLLKPFRSSELQQIISS